MLTERDKQVIAFERQWWKYAGSKEQAIRETFGMNVTRYYQVVNALLDNPEALAHDPSTINRLRRMRESRIRSLARARGSALDAGEQHGGHLPEPGVVQGVEGERTGIDGPQPLQVRRPHHARRVDQVRSRALSD